MNAGTILPTRNCEEQGKRGDGYKPSDRDNNVLRQENGTLYLQGKTQAIAMLDYDWPHDIAVEFKAKIAEDDAK